MSESVTYLIIEKLSFYNLRMTFDKKNPLENNLIKIQKFNTGVLFVVTYVVMGFWT